MVLSIKSAARASYYYQSEEHAGDRALAKGVWLFGSKTHGVNANSEVLPHHLDRLLHRKTADCCEEPLFSLKPGQSGYDFVFSAPKSISILWALMGQVDEMGKIAVGQRRLIERAHDKAVRAAAEVLKNEAIRERIGKGGKTLRPAEAAMASFLHFRCRPADHLIKRGESETHERFPDPNLHSHLIVPDLIVANAGTGGGRGTIKIAYTALYRRWSLALGAWYHAAFAHELAKLGLKLIKTGPNGIFSLEGFEHSWTLGFSARTHGAKNLYPKGDLATALAKTRQQSDDEPPAEIERAWAKHAQHLAVDLPKIVEPDPGAGSGADVLANKKLDWDKIIEEIVSVLSKEEAILQRQDIFRVIATYLVEKGLFLMPTSTMVDDVLASAQLEILPPSECYGLPQWTTCQNRQNEDTVEALAFKLSRAPFPRLDVKRYLDAAAVTLSGEQRETVEKIAVTGKLCVLRGGPGTGKTTLLEPLIEAAKAAFGSNAVIGAAEAWLQALQLNARFGIKALSLESFLNNANSKHSEELRRSDGPFVVIIDEAGLMSTARMLAVLEVVERHKMKLILLGDPEQLDPLSAGSGMRLVEGAAESFSLKAIQRQNAGPLHDVVSTMCSISESRHQAASKIDVVENRRKVRRTIETLSEKIVANKLWSSHRNSTAAISSIVDQLLEHYRDTAQAGTTLRALVRSHREAQHLTRCIRKRLRDEKFLQGEDRSMKAVTPMGQTHTLRLAVGDHIRFLKRNDTLGVYNGTEGKISDIEGDVDPKITVAVSSGTKIAATPGAEQISVTFRASEMAEGKKDPRIRLSCAYAMTIYGSQGATFDRVAILRSSRMRFRDLYVAISRARSAVEIVNVSLPELRRSGTTEGEAVLVESITRCLLAAEGFDHRKALAKDVDMRANKPRPEPDDWKWHVLAQDGIDGFLARQGAA